MALCPFAEQRTAGINNGGPRGHPIIGMTVHHMDGYWQGAESRFRDPSSNASAAFGIKFDGSLIQWLDTDLVDYHACQAQWEGWIGCENESDPATPNAPPTGAQIASMGRLIFWLGVPAVPATSRASGGVGYHRQFGGPCAEAWGQTDCPGDGFIAAIPAICAAGSGVTPKPVPVQEDDMNIVVGPLQGRIGNVAWLVAGGLILDEWTDADGGAGLGGPKKMVAWNGQTGHHYDVKTLDAPQMDRLKNGKGLYH